MRPTFGEKQNDDSRAKQIRSIFSRHPGTLPETTEHCIEDGVFSKAELRAFQVKGAINIVRQALKEEDDDGLPFAGPSTEMREGSRAPVWRPREAWLFADYELNYTISKGQGQSNIAVCNKLARECEIRYGRRPALLAVVECESSGDD